jgi:hypothetical protein
MRLVLQIPWPTPSLNDLANVRSRWAYKTTRARWERRVSDAWLEAKVAAGRGPVLWQKPPRCRVRVTIERFARTEHALDADNLVGGCKPVLDALRRLELIDEDRHAAIELVARQAKSPYRFPAMWTQITLERLDPEPELRGAG